MTVKAAIYVRISQDREGAGLGVQRQEEDCRELATRLGWEVADVYIDNDVSAYGPITKRKDYVRLLADIGNGSIGGVLAWHTDRLHRNPAQLEEYITLCEARSVTTHTVKAGEVDLATSTGRMVARLLGAIARKEVEQTGERVARARLQAAQGGHPAGGRRPFGYQADGITVHPAEADVVRNVTAGLIAGRSIPSIVRELNDAGIPTSVGGTWTQTAVRQLAKRPRNAGWSVYRGVPVARGNWEPIVPEEQWRAVCAVLADPTRLRRPIESGTKWLLSNLAECGMCGKPLMLTWVDHHKPAGRRRIYRCQGHVARAADPLDEYVTGAVLALVGSDVFRRGLAARLDGGGEVERLRTKAAGLRERLAVLAVQAGDLGFDLAQLRTANDAIRGQLAEVDARMVEVGAGAGPLGPLLAADDPEALWESLPLTVRRACVAAAMRVVVLPARRRGAGFDPGSVRLKPVARGEGVGAAGSDWEETAAYATSDPRREDTHT